MTTRSRDPLDLLGQLPTPEPDAARRQANIAAARARFADGAASRPVTRAPRRSGWRTWLIPGAAALAVVALVAVLIPQTESPRMAGSDSGLTHEEPPLARDGAAPPGTVMGARPPQAPAQSGAELPAAARTHDFDGFQIAVHDQDGAVSLSFLRDGSLTPFDRRSLDPGTGFELLDAFLLASPEAELLLLQSRIGDATNWDVFTIGPDGIRLSGELSLQVHDAPDRAAVARRLDAPG